MRRWSPARLSATILYIAPRSCGVHKSVRKLSVDGEGIGRPQIESALAKTGGKIAPAARLLGLKNRYALYRLMEGHGMRAPKDEPIG